MTGRPQPRVAVTNPAERVSRSHIPIAGQRTLVVAIPMRRTLVHERNILRDSQTSTGRICKPVSGIRRRVRETGTIIRPPY
jgi:hypothetical protein